MAESSANVKRKRISGGPRMLPIAEYPLPLDNEIMRIQPFSESKFTSFNHIHCMKELYEPMEVQYLEALGSKN